MAVFKTSKLRRQFQTGFKNSLIKRARSNVQGRCIMYTSLIGSVSITLRHLQSEITVREGSMIELNFF